MNPSMILFLLAAGIAFVAGVAVALTVSERAFASRDRRQALRERELQEISASVEAWLAENRGPRISGGP